MKKLPSAAEVRGMAGAVAYATRTSTIRKGTAVKLPDEIRDALLQFAELLERREEWTKKMAKAEDDIPGGIGVGGLLVDMGVKVNPEAE